MTEARAIWRVASSAERELTISDGHRGKRGDEKEPIKYVYASSHRAPSDCTQMLGPAEGVAAEEAGLG